MNTHDISKKMFAYPFLYPCDTIACMTPWRKLLYKKIKEQPLCGKVLDLGGSRISNYHILFAGTYTIEVVNTDEGCKPDYNFTLEESFPLKSETYDCVIGINVLEHVFRYENVLNESYRILQKGGEVFFAIPFLMFVHPSPNDYFRYTAQALEKFFQNAGFQDVKIHAVGSGPGAVFVQMIGGISGGVLARAIAQPFMYVLDVILNLLTPSKILRERFPLGYIVTAKKS
jgi:SAM-dependent methyltransferase